MSAEAETEMVERILDLMEGQYGINGYDEYMRSLIGTNRDLVKKVVSDFVEEITNA